MLGPNRCIPKTVSFGIGSSRIRFLGRGELATDEVPPPGGSTFCYCWRINDAGDDDLENHIVVQARSISQMRTAADLMRKPRTAARPLRSGALPPPSSLSIEHDTGRARRPMSSLEAPNSHGPKGHMDPELLANVRAAIAPPSGAVEHPRASMTRWRSHRCAWPSPRR